MEIIYKGVDELIPYANNTRTHTDEQINQIAGSIQEFGFNNPILIDDNNNVIAGHARLKASKKLGLDQVPCVVLNQMTEAQKKAYVIADNKMALNAGWDIDMLKVELEALEELDFDLELTGFNLAELDLIFEEEDVKPKKVNERQRTNNAYNLELFDEFVCDGKYQMPIIENDNFIPENIIGFNYAKTSKDKNVGIHFYIDDYQFERVWNAPSDYTNILDQYECIFTPDLKNMALGKGKGTIIASSGNRTVYVIEKTPKFNSKGFVKAMGSAKSTGNYDKDVNNFLRKNQKAFGYKYKTIKF